MFHGSRGIGGGPFTPTTPRRVASRFTGARIAYPFALRRTETRGKKKKEQYAVGDRLYRIDLTAHTRRNEMLLHQSERFITRLRSRSRTP